jgi:pilus assembly protein Flp/PilA
MWTDCTAYLWLRARGLASDNEGQGLTEYAIIIGVVAVALVGVLIVLEGGVSGLFNTVINSFPGA